MSSSRSRLFAALLTPPGRGAVATIGVHGTEARQVVAQLARCTGGKAFDALPLGQIALVRWLVAEGEEVVAVSRSQQSVELNCHGGTAAASAILQTLGETGCQQITWQAWLALHDADPLALAAGQALAHAPTLTTAAILLDQQRGALRNALQTLVGDLLANRLEAATQRLARLRQLAPLGQRLTQPPRVVLAGPPNVGKSSLINALLGYERAIVFDQPGTTRDVVTGQTAIRGWPIELADTAGLRSGGEHLEAEGMQRTREQLAEADLVLLVYDATSYRAGDEAALLATVAHASLVVLNKADLLDGPQAEPQEAITTGQSDGVDQSRGPLFVSARHGWGLGQLLAAIAARLVPTVSESGEAVPFTAAQAAALDRASELLVSQGPAAAAECLQADCLDSAC